MTNQNTIAKAVELMSGAKRGIVFTGAGISAESGIPTYRGHGGATWSRYDPNRYANIESFFSEPEYYWSFFRDVRSKILGHCSPNAGHLAIVELEKAGIIRYVITQNIDGLHTLAGSGKVLELHGNTRLFDCLSCKRKHNLEEVLKLQKKSLVPQCSSCGGKLKPRVVFFGESLDTTTLKTAMDEAAACDFMLVVGSTLQVHPAAHLPVKAVQNKKPFIIVNYGPTQLDELATCRLEGKSAQILPQLVDSIINEQGS